MDRIVVVDKCYDTNGIFIKKKSGNDDDEERTKNEKNNILDTSLHSFDPDKSSPPNAFFMKSFIRLKNY